MTRPWVEELELDVIARALTNPEGQAFRQLHRRYEPVVRWAVGCRVLRWPELVPSFEDIVQEVWIHLLRRRDPLLGYDPRRGVPFASFLALVASRTAWKHAKRRLRHPLEELHDEPDDDWDFTLALAHSDVLQRLAERVEMLDERSRRFFYGHYVSGRMIKDVGAELGLSDNTSHVFKLRLEKKLVVMAKALLDREASGARGSLLVEMTIIAALIATFDVMAVSSDRFAGLEGGHEGSPNGGDHRRSHGTVDSCGDHLASRGRRRAVARTSSRAARGPRGGGARATGVRAAAPRAPRGSAGDAAGPARDRGREGGWRWRRRGRSRGSGRARPRGQELMAAATKRSPGHDGGRSGGVAVVRHAAPRRALDHLHDRLAEGRCRLAKHPRGEPVALVLASEHAPCGAPTP